MTKLIVTTRTGEQSTLEAQPGSTIMETIRDSHIKEIEAICGGCCSCATCHVYIDANYIKQLPERSEDETILLEESPYFKPEASRLSCQIRVTEDLAEIALEIAPEY